MSRHVRGFDTEAAFDHLGRRDRKLGTWMKRIGYLEPQSGWRKAFDPVDALARAILYQQLSGKAASTIVGRVETAIGSTRLHFDTLCRIDDPACAPAACPATKESRLARPGAREPMAKSPLRQMSTMHQDEIVAALVPVRGIGRWTVEMMLMFRLGRPDVLPIDDLGIRKGAQRVDKLEPCRHRKSAGPRRALGPLPHLRQPVPVAYRGLRAEAKAPTKRFAGLRP